MKRGGSSTYKIVGLILGICLVFVGLVTYGSLFPQVKYEAASVKTKAVEAVNILKSDPPSLDKALYDRKLAALANYASTTSTTTKRLWPVKTAYPKAGAILPFNRIVAYYGNFYSTQMGALGQYPPDEMIPRLMAEVNKWHAADPTTPVIPAIHYIAATAQGSAGADGKYRFRMPDSQIDKAIEIAGRVNGIVFLDLQVGLSNLRSEIPALEKYLKMPQVHLGIDPEFSMKGGQKPGTVIGTFDAADINYASDYLANLVRENNLPPKILIVHRFTGDMVTHSAQIKTQPEVQIVMDMDGWGSQARKINTYNTFIYSEPVQFTGFKLFYKNDFREAGSRIMTPAEVLKLRPKPSYIQYQ
jgi:hypothetical protein